MIHHKCLRKAGSGWPSGPWVEDMVGAKGKRHSCSWQAQVVPWIHPPLCQLSYSFCYASPPASLAIYLSSHWWDVRKKWYLWLVISFACCCGGLKRAQGPNRGEQDSGTGLWLLTPQLTSGRLMWEGGFCHTTVPGKSAMMAFSYPTQLVNLSIRT